MKTKEILKEWKNYLNEVADERIYDTPDQVIDFTNDENYFHEYKAYCESILQGVDYRPDSFDAGHKKLYSSIVSEINDECKKRKKRLEYARKSENLYYQHPDFRDLESKELKDQKFDELIKSYETKRDNEIAELHNSDGTINRDLVYKISSASDISYITYDAKFVLDTNGNLYIKMKDRSLSSVTEEILPFRGEEG